MENQNIPSRNTINIGLTAALALVGVIFFVSVGQAVGFSLVHEDHFSKKDRLEASYEAQVGIINKADEVIAKQMKLKEEAEQVLKSLAVDLATTKASIELTKEDPDMAEINRLTEKASHYAKELGN